MKQWQGLWAIPDMSGFGHIGTVSGVRHYADRALLPPFEAAVVEEVPEDRRGDFESYLEFLRDNRLGPKRVIRVRGRSLFEGILNDPGVAEELRMHAYHGGRIQVFSMTEEAEECFEKLGLDQRHLHSAPMEIARQFNDKGELRRMHPGAFPEHVITRNHSAVMSAADGFAGRIGRDIDFVVVKPTDRAGGDGILFIDDAAQVHDLVPKHLAAYGRSEVMVEGGTERVQSGDPRAIVNAVRKLLGKPEGEVKQVTLKRVSQFGMNRSVIRREDNILDRVDDYIRKYQWNEFVVEAGYHGLSFSNQFVIDGASRPRMLGPTLQVMDPDPSRRGKHLGNIFLRSLDPLNLPPGMSLEDSKDMEMIALPFAGRAQKHVTPYVGTIGFDFLKSERDGRLLLLECNARQTAATYPLSVSAQLEDRAYMRRGHHGAPDVHENWAVYMLNAVPTSAQSFEEVRRKVALFDGRHGVLPFNIRLMYNGEPRACGIIVVEATLEAALARMEETKGKLLE